MFKKLISIILIVSLQSVLVADDYSAGGDFSLDYSLNGHGDVNFSNFTALGAQSVLAGMDFDGDSLYEILFTIDETLAPGGPDPGKLGVFLYEADGSGGYNHVWHFVTPQPGNSLPGMFHADIDGDGLHEIYFGVPPAVGYNDATWGTYIFEQNADLTFPTTATLLYQYGMTSADNFRPAGYEVSDLDGDGIKELCTVDRGVRRLSIDEPPLAGFDNLSTFTSEYLDTLDLNGGSLYNLDAVDFDGDGKNELWVNTWNNFSMTVFEATGTDAYSVESKMDQLYTTGDAASFRRNGFAFYDADGDTDLDAWFPMTDGKLYYLENTVSFTLDDLSLDTNLVTNGGLESGTTGWDFFPSPMTNMALMSTGDTLLPPVVTSTMDTTSAGVDTTLYDTSAAVLFTAHAGTAALKVSGAGGNSTENNAFYTFTETTSIAPGTQFAISAEFLHSSVDSFSTLGAHGTLFAKYFAPGWAFLGMESVDFQGSATADAWHHLDQLCTVPAGATVVQVGLMFTAPDSSSTSGSFYADDLMLQAADSLGVNFLAADDFSEVLRFGSRNRGSDMGDIDGDGKMDIIATTGTGETVVRMEFMGGDPTSASRYDVSTIFESKGEPADRYYPLDISDNDLDGDGNLEVVLTNLYASNATQPQIFVLDYDKFSFDKGGDNPEHLAPNWSVAAMSYGADVDSVFGHDSRTVIGGMDMDGDGKKEVISNDYAGRRVVVFEYDAANNAFDAVWTSPVITTHYAYNPRTMAVGDLDGDGRQEIVFPSANDDSEGYHIYEWDGVVGSDNYGTTYASVCQVEIDKCCAGDGAGTASYGASFRGDHDRLTIFDVDGDGRDEFVQHIRRGNPRGTLVYSLTDGDDLVSGSGGGLETWVEEFWVNRSDYGGGSPLHALPADLNGDGHYEVINHTWNAMHFYNITSTDTGFAAPVVGSTDSYYKATAGSDQYSIWGGYANDIDGDGNDEAYFASYGSWGVGSGDVYVVDYDSTDDVLKVNGDHVVKIASNIGQFIGDVGSGYDGDLRKTLFVGRTVPNITALKYIGPDPRSPLSYLKEVIYYGEHDVVNTTITIDSTGTDTVYSGSPWGFASKIETSWGGELLDFDADGKKELLVSYQSIDDSLSTTVKTWVDSLGDYSSVTTKVVNHKDWTFILLENGTDQTGLSTDPIRFVLPDDYRLDQNYPNPFNPNTTIRYTIPINRKVSIKVYNITGQLVRTLIDNEMANAGTHNVVWNGKNNFGRNVSTGIYLYSLEWAGMKKVKRMTLVK